MDKYKFFSVPFGLLAGLIIFLGLVGCQDFFLLKQWGTIEGMQYTNTTTPTLTWDAVDDANAYEVQIWDSDTTLILNEFPSKNEYDPPGLTSNTTYSWKVRALDTQPGSTTAATPISRAGAWSETSNFTVNQATLEVTLEFASIIQVPTNVGNVPIGNVPIGKVTTRLSYPTDYQLTITETDGNNVGLGISIDTHTNEVTISSVQTVSDSGFYTVTATGQGNYTGTVKATFELIVTTLNLNLVPVEGGTFRMGSADVTGATPHDVTVSDFYMSKYEITFAQYNDYVSAMQNSNTPIVLPDDKGWGVDTRPVINVSWYDAVGFLNWLSEQDRFTPVYTETNNSITWDFSKNGYRLPTEAEWEYAARGGNISQVDYTYSGSNTVGEVAWYQGNSRTSALYTTQPVGEKNPNELGLHDMSGNVYEWCWDMYGDYSQSARENPTGGTNSTLRMQRGGDFKSTTTSPNTLHVAYRGSGSPGSGTEKLGFRLVRNMLSIPSN